MRHRLSTSIALAVVFTFGSVACGSDDDDSSGTTSSTVEADGSSATTTDGPSTSEPSSAEAPSTTLPEPLADQTPPTSINGLTVQGEGLWIASISEDAVFLVDRATGAILTRYDTFGAGPDDVAVAPDGAVWVTGFEGGVVGRIVGGQYEEEAAVDPMINGIDVAADGTVYAATMEEDGTLYRIMLGAEPEVVATGLKMFNAFEIDESNGTIIGPSDPFGTPVMVRVDPADGSIVPVAEGIPAVAATTMDPDGRFIALANVTGQVLAVDLETGTFEVIATVPDGAPFDNIAYSDDGTLYLSSFVAPTVTEVKPDGTVRVIPIGTAVPSGG